ncbi:MAG: hypothetical protein LUD76_04885 [Alistipes sp.]|nr:hypothetical protein [Alistipes sp.]
MKIKHLLLASVALIAGMASCSKDNNGGDEPESFDILIQFDLGVESRADVDNLIRDGVTVTTLNDGKLFFTDGDGVIYRMVDISNNATPGAVTPEQLKNGKLFEDISKSATFVHVFGNHNFAKSSYSNISEVEEEEVEILDQTDTATFGVNKANLYGRKELEPASTAIKAIYPNVVKQAIFDIVPIIARLEIDQFLGTGDVQSYTIAGIYVHNFYEKVAPTAALLPSPDDAPWRVSGSLQDWTKYQEEPAGDYDSDWDEFLFDTPAAVSNTTKLAQPVKDTWAYNVFANAGAEPHIVIHLTDVMIGTTAPGTLRPNTAIGSAGDGEAYLTITGYRTDDTNSDKVNIKGGNVYKIRAVGFDEDDLGDTPYPKEDMEQIYVEVKVTPWIVNYVTPEFD